MKSVLSVVLLLLCEVIEEFELRIITDSPDVMNRTDRYGERADFRCYAFALEGDFDFDGCFVTIGYAIKIDKLNKKLRCTGFAKQDYPILTGTDPMMVCVYDGPMKVGPCAGTRPAHSFVIDSAPANLSREGRSNVPTQAFSNFLIQPYYINNLHRGIALAKTEGFMSRMTPLQRTKEYCASMHLKMVDFIKISHEFRQMREMFAGKMYDKLCLSEDGCYNVMAYYENDLPYCVKNTAINLFKNSSVGSWHHTIINYCKLTEMVPGINEEKYDMKILTQKGRTREKLREMCLYLRYRLLPEEGKEQEIPEDMADYDTDTETTTIRSENENGASTLGTAEWWSVVFVLFFELSFVLVSE